ncbi:hypothetical protein NPX13_g6825 [Xylaria arbuscula]|uniref:Uncharacterized protein n=1 Tax=Xylaria arbuscula TaxID=114810 RepID=A0A9W8TLS3_9PEZI|nr:hypothetical protein NPX13_g6825 [Xylaria arbuscula]
MSFTSFIGSIFIVVVAVVVAMHESTATNARLQCRSIPSDPSWLSDDIWANLNDTVYGRLITAVPIAAPCHASVFEQPNELFNEDKCAILRDNWFFPETHLLLLSSPMAYPFSNNSCNPFLDKFTPCALGSYPVLYFAITTFVWDTLLDLVDAGAFVVFIAAPFGCMILPAILNKLGLEHQYSFTGYPIFIEGYEALQLISSWNVSDYNIGSRIIPRDLTTQNLESLVEAIRYISSRTLMSGVSYNLESSGLAPDDLAVNPYMRQALFSLIVGTPIDYVNWTATELA